MSSVLCLIFSLVFLLVTVLALLGAIRTTRAWRQVREAEQEHARPGDGLPAVLAPPVGIPRDHARRLDAVQDEPRHALRRPHREPYRPR